MIPIGESDHPPTETNLLEKGKSVLNVIKKVKPLILRIELEETFYEFIDDIENELRKIIDEKK